MTYLTYIWRPVWGDPLAIFPRRLASETRIHAQFYDIVCVIAEAVGRLGENFDAGLTSDNDNQAVMLTMTLVTRTRTRTRTLVTRTKTSKVK